MTTTPPKRPSLPKLSKGFPAGDATELENTFKRTYDALEALASYVKPYLVYTKSASQTLTTATDTAVTWDTARHPDGADGGVVRLTGSKIVAVKACRVLVSAAVSFAANVTGIRAAWQLKNGVTTATPNTRRGAVKHSAASAGTTDLLCTAPWDLNPGDYLEVWVHQSSGGNLAITGGEALADCNLHVQVL